MKFIFRLIFRLFFAAAIVAGVFFYGAEGVNLIKEKYLAIKTPTEEYLPALSGQRKSEFRWEYGGKQYELELDLYQSTYDFYRNKSKEYKYYGDLPSDWKHDYYKMFMTPAEGDETFDQLTNEIRQISAVNKFSADQTVELALAFVQQIPYDDARAAAIIKHGEKIPPNYPYEVLFEKKGICSDKTFLAGILIGSLGYGTAIFEYASENHMALGIQCTQRNSNYASGYCHAETTSQSKIGLIPNLKSESNQTIAVSQMNHFGEDVGDQNSLKELTSVEIFRKTGGASYNGVSKTLAIQSEINKLQKEIFDEGANLKKEKPQVAETEEAIGELKKKMDKLKKSEDFEEYNALVPEYNSLVEKYRKQVKEYNAEINAYNAKIDRYNELVKELNG